MEKEKIELPKRTKPFGINNFYKELKSDYTDKFQKAQETVADTEDKIDLARRKMEKHLNEYKIAFNVNLYDYKEFVENRYIDGELERKAYFIYRNYRDNIHKIHVLRFVKYSVLLRNNYKAKKNLELYTKILSLSYAEYKRVLKAYYYEVQHQMIANGYCYKFSGKLGWLCINRIKNRVGGNFKTVDTKATRAKKKELQDAGIEVYDHEKALYCKLNNIPYNGVEYMQYKNVDHTYEIILLNSKLPPNKGNKTIYIFEPSNFWSVKMREKTQEDIEKEANGIIRNVTCLDIPFRRKLLICDKMDKTLYVNFIRNENQTSIAAPKNYR